MLFNEVSVIMAGAQQGVAWSADLETGDERVDSQHRQLFVLLNNLIMACADGSGEDKLFETLGFLTNYTVQHFNDEEALQLQYDFPEFERHKKMHDGFKAKVGELVQRFMDSGSSEALLGDVNRIVAVWLINHIHREDKKICVHIRGLGA